MTTQPFRRSRSADADSPWQFLATAEETGGAILVGEAVLPPHTQGPALHVHEHEDECGYVAEGVFTVQLGDEVFDMTAGEFVWLPRGVPHAFANRSDEPVRVVGVITPPGLEGMFKEQQEYFASLSGPPDESVIDEIGARYGVRRAGPPLEAGP